MISYDGIVTIKTENQGKNVRTYERQEKIDRALKKFHQDVGKKARENEMRAVKSLEYARHAIAK